MNESNIVYLDLKRKAEAKIVFMMKFAKNYLKIRKNNFEKDFILNGYGFNFEYKAYWEDEHIVFNGIPSAEVVFHESVHQFQYERGDDLYGSFSKELKFYLRDSSYDEYGLDDLKRLAYYSSDIEIEANELSKKMVKAYNGS